MKKKILIIISILLVIILLDSLQALIFNDNTILKIKEYYDGGNLNYISKGIFVDTYNCVSGKKDAVIKGFSYSCFNEEVDISLEDINTKIIDYFSKENVDLTNYVYNYVDSEKNVVVVGLVDNSKSMQEEFVFKVFSNCCGSKYIDFIKDNQVIEFKESKYVFDAKIIIANNDNITVEVLEDTDNLKKGDKVTMKIKRPTNGINDFYVVGNNVKITFNGNTLTSNPMMIDAIKIELIS